MKYKSTAVRIARQKYGVSFNDIKEGMRLANTDDPDLGARYSLANSLSIKVHGDRHEWNLRVAKSMLNGN